MKNTNLSSDAYAFVPMEMKALKNWVVATDAKIPINVNTGYGASPSKPENWASYEKSLLYLASNYNKEHIVGTTTSAATGLGFMFSKECGIVGIDIDHCLDKEGKPTDVRVEKLLEMADTYTEISKSGTGVHIYVRGEKPFTDNRIHLTENIGLEVYDDRRFFYVSGNLLEGKPSTISDGQQLLDYIGATFFAGKTATTKGETVSSSTNVQETEIPEYIWAKLEAALEKDRFFDNRWNGIRYGKKEGEQSIESENDMALLCRLVEVADKNPDYIKTLFLASPYVESKDEKHKEKVLVRQDYLDSSIANAIKYVEMGLNAMTAEGISYEDFNLLFYEFNDDGNAERFLEMFKDNIAYCEDEGIWYVYNGKYWAKDKKKLRLSALAKDLYTRLQKACKAIEDVDARKQMEKNVKRLGNQGTKTSMFAAAEALAGVSKERFNNHPDKLVVKNGVVDLRSGGLLPFSNEYLLTQAVTEVDYLPDAEEPKLFIKFLHEILNNDEELYEYVCRVMGYLLSGETKESKFFICYGAGNNGKSVLFNLLRRLFGTYGDSMSPNGILEKRNKDSLNTDIMKVRDGRMVTIDELQSSDRLNTSLLKNITGGKGERLNVREMYGTAESFSIEFKLVFNTNFLPDINWFDYAMERRAVVIPFDVIIPKHKVDMELPDKLWQEKEAILSFIIRQAQKYYAEGLPALPAAVKAAYKKNLEKDFPVKAFFEEAVEITGNTFNKVQAEKLYCQFVEWCYAHGMDVDEKMKIQTFGRQARLINGIGVMKDSYHHTQYLGVKVKAEQEAEEKEEA